MGICFIVRDRKIGSAHLRASQLACELNKRGTRCEVLDWKDLWASRATSQEWVRLAIFVKEWEPSLARLVKSRTEAKISYDLVDSTLLFHGEAHGEVYCDVDFFIVSSNYQKLALEQRCIAVEREVWTIPHHHSNLKGLRIDPEQKVKTVGFLGDITNQLPAEFEAELRELCKKLGANWRTTYVHEFQQMHRTDSPEELNIRLHQHLNELDISVIYPPVGTVKSGCSNKTPLNWDYLLYKPATRLLNCLSHGIPTVAFPYVSYLEVCSADGYPLLEVQPKGILDIVLQLIGSAKMRMAVSQLGLQISERYSIERVCIRYRELLGRNGEIINSG